MDKSRDVFTNMTAIEGQDTESESIIEQVSKESPMETSLSNNEDGYNNSGHVEEIDKWVESMERILNDVPAYMGNRGHPGRLSRIPENLREVDVKGYEPYILSIGPYHHGKLRLQHMEKRKKVVLKFVLENMPELTLKDFLKVVVNIEPTARSFYSDVQMETETFVQMLLLDSVYIVTAFCGIPKSQEKMIEGNLRDEYDDENVRADESKERMGSGVDWYWAMFAHDLFLIENQIPFIVLQKIHDLAYRGSGTQFIDIMKYEVANILTYYTKINPTAVSFQTEEVHHLLHLGHMFFLPKIQRESTACHFQESSQMFRLGSAGQLYESGVHFEARSGSDNYSLIDITFDSSGKMSLPCLHVDDNTESLLRNLIALEQMKYPSLGLNISAYIVLLLHLITVPKDVELLRRKGIIQHHLASDKEMMYLINRLSIGLAFDYVEDKYSLKQVFHELKHYSERRAPRWRAWLKHRHFSNPWTTISLLAAFILLLLTVLQTFYAVYSYYHPYFNGHS